MIRFSLGVSSANWTMNLGCDLRQPQLPVCSSSARNRGKFRMELPSSRKPTFGVCGSASVRFISERVGSIDFDAFFPCFVGSSEILYLPHILVAGELCYRQESAIGGWNGPEVISGAK